VGEKYLQIRHLENNGYCPKIISLLQELNSNIDKNMRKDKDELILG
jgi:hypothetical protein